MENKKSYLQRLAEQLQEWDTEIDELKLKAHLAKAEAKDELQKQLEDLRVKREAAQSKFQMLQESGDDAWEDIKEGVEKSWKELKGAFTSALSKFKDDSKT